MARNPRKVIAIRPEMHEKLVAIAKKEKRTITAVIERWIEKCYTNAT